MDGKMDAKAIHYAATCAPRKARRLRSLIVGKTVNEAIAQLKCERRAGSVDAVKLIRSALAQLPADVKAHVKVADFVVNEGPKRVTFMPRAQGRASPIRKRTSHLEVHLKII